MDEQLKEWLKDVDDKCEYSDEAIDVQTFTDMLSSYFVDYRILLYEKEKKVRDSKIFHFILEMMLRYLLIILNQTLR